MKEWHNREKAAKTITATNLKKRQLRYDNFNPYCKICKNQLTFEEFSAGRKDLCPSKLCRSIINTKNSQKQDKSKIGEYLRRSEKWSVSQRELLLKKRSRIEIAYSNIFASQFSDVQHQVHLKFSDGTQRFADFIINGIVVEIDGPYHQESRDVIYNECCAKANIQIIRIDITRHWTDLFSEIGDIINRIRGC